MKSENEPKKATEKMVRAKVAVVNEQPVAKFCNLVQLSVTPGEGEAVFDFIYINRSQINPKTNEVRAFHVDRIVMTINQARKFSEKLAELLSKT